MRRLLAQVMVIMILGCAQGELAVDGAVTAENCLTDSECADGQTCLAGACFAGCSTDSDCVRGRCVPHPAGSGGWCDTATAPSPDETIVSPGETSVSPPADEPIPTVPEPESEPEAEPEAEGPSPSPPAERPSPPPVEPPAPPPPAPEPAPEPEPEPQPAPEPPPEAAPPCDYPQAAGDIRLGSVMPRLSWPTVYTADGASAPFDLRDFHCDPAYDRYSILVVVVGAEWCNACGQYLRQLAGQAAGVDAAGGLILYVETQDAQHNWISSRRANQVINGYVGQAPGLRIGDGETQPGPGAIYNAPIVSVLPTVFAVRRSDMSIIEEGAQDWAAVARREHGGGGAPPANPPNVPPANCVEEAQEPNNQPNAAALLPEGQGIEGGICDGSADFYRVTHQGAWTLDLTFRHSDGDLDVYVWNPFEEDVLFDPAGEPVGSDSITDNEQFSLFGEQIIVIVGYEGALAPYRLHLNGH